MSNTSYTFQILMKLEFSRHIFEKYSKHHITRKTFQWETSCSMRTAGRPDGRTHRHEEANSRLSQFCERA
jgi:hypothetical protein